VRRFAGGALGLLGLGLLFLSPTTAYGHAALVRSDPPANAFIQRPPTEVSVTFSEPVDSRSSTLAVLDAAGARIPVGPMAFSRDGLTIRLPVGILKPGIYNVLWANVSSVDGHAYRGSFPFTVLKADGSLPDQVNTVSGIGGDADPPPLADGVAVRALGFLGMLIAAAGAVLLLLWPESGRAKRGFSSLLILGAGVLFASALLNLVLLRDVYSGITLADFLLQTRGGGYLLARLGAALFIGVAASLLYDAPRKAALAVLGGVGVFGLAFAATSHGAAGTGSNWGTALDLFHGLAAVGWIGAVIGVAVGARLSGRGEGYRALMPRFSLLASVLVFVLLATGSLSAFIELDGWDRFTSTRYGVTLLVKLALLVPLLSVAFWNARWGRRRLTDNRPGEPRRFVFTATIEVVLGLAVFVAAAMLTQTTTAKSIVDTPEAKPYERSSPAGDLNVKLSVDPNRTGINTYRVSLTGANAAPVDADRVRLTFRYLDDQNVGPSTLTLSPTDGGVSSGQGPYLTIEGNWRVEAEIRRPNVDDLKGFFDVRPAGSAVNTAGRGGVWDNPAPGLSANQFGGFAVLLVGLGFAFWGARIGKLHRYAGWGANGVTITGFGLGVLLLFGVHAHPEDSASQALSNPIFPDQNSIATGRALFGQNCAACHGLNGVPPKGLDLNPYPLDLTVHVPAHPDGQLFSFVSNGIPGSAMRAWASGDGKLSTEQIWHLVNFLRTLTPVDK
jgi:copper transport protein